MKKFLIGLGILLACVGACVYFVMQTAKDLQPLAEKVLKDLDAGRVAELHERTSKSFRTGTDLAALEEIAKQAKEMFGDYQGVIRLGNTGVGTTVGGPTVGDISLELRYSKTRAQGDFQFVKEDGAWRLQKFNIKPIAEALGSGD